MGTTKIIMAVALVLMGQLYGQSNLISNEGVLSEVLETVKLSYAECDDGIVNTNRTIVVSIDRRMEVVHSVAEAIAFVKSAKDNSSFFALIPTVDRMQMDATFCDQPQAEKDSTLLAAVQAELSD